LSRNVRFVSMVDKEGTFGLFVVHNDDYVYETREVTTREEFTQVYEELRTKLEQY